LKVTNRMLLVGPLLTASLVTLAPSATSATARPAMRPPVVGMRNALVTVVPARAYDFTNSFGINNDNACVGSDEDRAALAYYAPLRLRYVRTAVGDYAPCGKGATKTTADMVNEFSNLGIRADALTASDIPPAAVTSFISLLTLPPVACEGPNEPDLNKQRYNPYPGAVLTYGQALRANTACGNAIPFLGPSFTSGWYGTPGGPIPSLNPPYQYANLHYYGARAPENTGYGGRIGPCGAYGAQATFVCAAKSLGPYSQFVTTETGYGSNYPNCKSSQTDVDARTQSPYLQRDLLNLFALGSKQTYLFNFLDGWAWLGDPCGGPNVGFSDLGLLHHYKRSSPLGYSGVIAPKRSYTALAYMMNLLYDPRPPMGTSSYQISLTGTLPSTQTQFFQKGDGSTWMAIWDNSPLWDPVANVDIPTKSYSVTLATPTRHASQDYVQNPATGIFTSVALGPPYAITVNGWPQLLEFTTGVPAPLPTGVPTPGPEETPVP